MKGSLSHSVLSLIFLNRITLSFCVIMLGSSSISNRSSSTIYSSLEITSSDKALSGSHSSSMPLSLIFSFHHFLLQNSFPLDKHFFEDTPLFFNLHMIKTMVPGRWCCHRKRETNNLLLNSFVPFGCSDRVTTAGI